MSAPHSGRAHAKLSPSSAHRWMECPGSIAACEGIPNTSSSFADEGTAAHELCETCLAKNIDADFYIGRLILVNGAGHEVTEEMAESVQVYLDFVRPLYEGAEVEVEAKLDLRHIPGMEFGTGDFCAYNPLFMRLDIVDFKYGKGVAVEVEDNPQLLAYALGVAKRYHNRGIKKVRLAVIQPRCPHPKGPIRVKEYDATDLLDFEAVLVEAAVATEQPNAPLKAGEWCKFCPAAPGCKEFMAESCNVAADIFGTGDENHLMVVPLMNADELGFALRQAYLLKAWLKRMEEFAHAEAMAGRMPTGHKLVPKRASRKWINLAVAERALDSLVVNRELLYTEPELKSPAQVEPLIPGKNKTERARKIAELVESVSSGTNLVPIEDPREPARPEVEGIFEAV